MAPRLVIENICQYGRETYLAVKDEAVFVGLSSYLIGFQLHYSTHWNIFQTSRQRTKHFLRIVNKKADFQVFPTKNAWKSGETRNRDEAFKEVINQLYRRRWVFMHWVVKHRHTPRWKNRIISLVGWGSISKETFMATSIKKQPRVQLKSFFERFQHGERFAIECKMTPSIVFCKYCERGRIIRRQLAGWRIRREVEDRFGWFQIYFECWSELLRLVDVVVGLEMFWLLVDADLDQLLILFISFCRIDSPSFDFISQAVNCFPSSL